MTATPSGRRPWGATESEGRTSASSSARKLEASWPGWRSAQTSARLKRVVTTSRSCSAASDRSVRTELAEGSRAVARQASARSEAFQAAHSRASTSRGASAGVCPMAERRASRILAALRSRSAWALSGCPCRDRAKPEACSGSASRARRAVSPPVRRPAPAAGSAVGSTVGSGVGPVVATVVLGSLGSAAPACGVAAGGAWRSLRRSRRRSMVVSPTRGLVRRLMATSRWGGSPCPPSWSRMAARTMSRSAAAAGSARSRTAGVREARGTPRRRRSLARVSASAALRTMTAI